MPRYAIIAILALAAGCVGTAAVATDSDPSASVASPAATEAFCDAIISAIRTTIAANSAADPTRLEALLETALQNVFVVQSVSPQVAAAGVNLAKTRLTSDLTYCTPPGGPPTSQCEAVGKALDLAITAANAALAKNPGSLGGTPGNTYGAPPGAGSGGGGGGVTHPPVG